MWSIALSPSRCCSSGVVSGSVILATACSSVRLSNGTKGYKYQVVATRSFLTAFDNGARMGI